jgi:hypothetical protein
MVELPGGLGVLLLAFIISVGARRRRRARLASAVLVLREST